MPTIGLLHSTIRGDEKLIIEAAKKRDVPLELIDIRTKVFNPETYKVSFDIGLERSISTVKGMYAVEFLESLGIPVVNSSHIARICEDKFLTSLVLRKAHIPIPKFALVFTFEQAKEAIEQIGGFPIVVKPNLGSWGRLLAKVNDMDALEALLEHKEVLGSPQQKAYYLQQYIKKPGRDIRINIFGNKVIAAIYRQSEHWITNTAQGAIALNCKIDKKLETITQKTAKAIGGGLLGIDVFETDEGYIINEVNHTTEFKNVQKVTQTDIAGEIIDYCLNFAKK